MAVSRHPGASAHREIRAILAQRERVEPFLLFMLSLGLFLLFWEVGARAGWFVQGVPTASVKPSKSFGGGLPTPFTTTAPTI
jgi:nitrate/nitrite transport system permease protein